MLECPARAREDEDAVSLVDDWSLFGNQVHPIDERINQQNIVKLQCRKSLCAVILHESMDWFPPLSPKFLVEVLDDFKNFILVLLVYGDSLTRWHEKRQECYLPTQLRMVLKHILVGLKTLYNVLCQLDTIHTHNCLLAEQRPYAFRSMLAGGALYDTTFL